MTPLIAFHEMMASGVLVTLNPSDKSAAVTLSGGNLVATHDGTANWDNARATVTLGTTGKWFWSTALTAQPTANIVGIANATATLTNYLGSDANAVGYQTANGAVLISGITLSTIMTSAAGDVVDTAVDLDNAKIWFRKNGGNWNNSGAANPATNVGGISLATLAAGPYYVAAGLYQNSVETVNFGGSTLPYAPPSGFSPVGG